MQQKVNAVSVMAGNEEKVFEDVTILKGAEGLYIETVEKIGTDNDGNDLTQNVLTMYPWEKVVSLAWKENTLIELLVWCLNLKTQRKNIDAQKWNWRLSIKR